MIDTAAPVKPTRNELLKQADPTLAGTILETLRDESADHFSEDDYEFLKFHGVYQQDDRDLRKSGKKHIFMVRGRLPGGFVTPRQYLVFDDLAARYGNSTLRITSRQGFQFHGVVKGGLRLLIHGINEALGTTLAACGDVNRNVMAPPTPSTSAFTDRVQEDARRVSNALMPRTRAYHEIWIDDAELDLTREASGGGVDPLYGTGYLPRKFKVAFAIPPLNDTDVLTNCLGFVAIGAGDRLLGYDVLAGGGLGMSHGNARTFPRLADVIGYVPAERVVDAARAVVAMHRDFGDRTNRKHARLKYVLAERGADWFRGEVEQRLGFPFEPARPFEFKAQGDRLGWHEQFDGNLFLGLYVETGRIKDNESCRLKSALREVVARFQPEIRLTPSQNLVLANVRPKDRDAITQILVDQGVAVENQAGVVRRNSMACPALPTCGLALAESERVLPDLLTRLEGLLAEVGLREQEIVIRMTGCPNGCARPYTAEIGFVGKAPGRYNILLGGSEAGTRLNRVFREGVKDEAVISDLRPVFARYARERAPDERFGNWCARVLWSESPGSAAADASGELRQLPTP